MVWVFKIFWHKRYQNDISTSSFYCELLLKPMISTKKKSYEERFFGVISNVHFKNAFFPQASELSEYYHYNF